VSGVEAHQHCVVVHSHGSDQQIKAGHEAFSQALWATKALHTLRGVHRHQQSLDLLQFFVTDRLACLLLQSRPDLLVRDPAAVLRDQGDQCVGELGPGNHWEGWARPIVQRTGRLIGSPESPVAGCPLQNAAMKPIKPTGPESTAAMVANIGRELAEPKLTGLALAHLLVCSRELLHNLLIDTARRPRRIEPAKQS
jgi:hypothetical protein